MLTAIPLSLFCVKRTQNIFFQSYSTLFSCGTSVNLYKENLVQDIWNLILEHSIGSQPYFLANFSHFPKLNWLGFRGQPSWCWLPPGFEFPPQGQLLSF